MLGIFFAIGDSVAANGGSLLISLQSLMIKGALFAFIFSTVFYLGSIFINHIQVYKVQKNFFLDKVGLLFNSKRARTYLWILLFVAWIPWIVLLCPGIYWSDTSQQLLEHFGVVALTDHHPYLVTIIFGLFADFGNTFFGSVSCGLFFLVIIQCICASGAFASFIYELWKNNLGLIACIVLIVFVAFFPFIPVMFCSLAKDTISAVFFLFFCLYLYKLVIASRNKSKLSKSIYFYILIFALMTALTKKTALYVVLISLCFLFLYCHSLSSKNNLNISSAVGGLLIVFCLVVFIIVPKMVLPANNIIPGGKQEAIASLIQQVAHDVKFNRNELSKSDIDLVDDFLLSDSNRIDQVYDWQIVDPVKQRGLKNPNRFMDFLELWGKNSIKFPLGHLEAWLGLVDGWISFHSDKSNNPNYMVVLTYSGWHDSSIKSVSDWNDQPTIGGMFAERIYKKIQDLPILRFFFFRSIWATVLPFMCWFIMFEKKYRPFLSEWLVLQAPVFASCLTLLIVPVSIMGGEPTRYLFGLICVLPFMLFGACTVSSSI